MSLKKNWSISTKANCFFFFLISKFTQFININSIHRHERANSLAQKLLLYATQIRGNDNALFVYSPMTIILLTTEDLISFFLPYL